MGIDNIKPPAGPGPFVDPAAEAPSGPEQQSSFPGTVEKLQLSDPSGLSPSALRVVSQFQRSALDDGAKRQAMVRACVSELVDSNQNMAGPLSGADKESLVNFLSSDPMVRSQIETYLQKVLV